MCVCVCVFCLLHHKFALWLFFCCFVLRCVFLSFNYFITGTVILWFLLPTFVTIYLSFFNNLSAYERFIWDAKETRTRKKTATKMNGVFFSLHACEWACVCISKWTKSKRSHLEMKNTNNNAPRFECVISEIADIKTESDDMAGNFYLELPTLKLSFIRSFVHSIRFAIFFDLVFNRH